MIEQGLQAIRALNQRMVSSIVELLVIIIALLIVRAIFRTLIRIMKGIWNLLTGRRKNPLNSEDWLTRAQAKQEIRFQNSLPPLLPKQKTQRKKHRFPWQQEEGKDWYATGWTLNKETGLWEPPDYMK